MDSKYAKSFAQFESQTSKMRAKGLVEWRTNEEMELKINDAPQAKSLDRVITIKSDELKSLAKSIGKDDNWLQDMFMQEISDIAQTLKDELLPRFKAAKETNKPEDAENIKKEMAILTQIKKHKEAELTKEIMDLDPENDEQDPDNYFPGILKDSNLESNDTEDEDEDENEDPLKDKGLQSMGFEDEESDDSEENEEDEESNDSEEDENRISGLTDTDFKHSN